MAGQGWVAADGVDGGVVGRCQMSKEEQTRTRSIAHQAEAHFKLGQFLDSRRQRDSRGAVEAFRLAAQLGHAEAANLLGESLRDGNGTRRNGTEAVHWFEIAAKRGSTAAQLSLGYELFTGRFTRRNRAAAMVWYRKASRAGDFSAKFNVAQMYERGEGVHKDLGRATRWYVLAAKGGHVGAMRRLAEIYQRRSNSREMMFWLRRAAAAGEARSLCDLGVHYHEGNGVRKNFTRAVQLYRVASRHGDSWARYLLGLCYRDGEGVRRSPVRARAWLSDAATDVPEAAQALADLQDA